MKTSPENDELLNEVLSDESSTELRTTSLDDILTAVRRQRRLRHALRCAGPITALGILTAILWYRHAPAPESVVASGSHPSAEAMAAPTVPGTSIRVVSDEELLAMFPDRPVALIGPPEERRFVFLDERRNLKPREAPGRDLNL